MKIVSFRSALLLNKAVGMSSAILVIKLLTLIIEIFGLVTTMSNL